MPENEPLLKFQLPEMGELKVYAVKTKDGRILARTEDELEKIPEEVKAE